MDRLRWDRGFDILKEILSELCTGKGGREFFDRNIRHGALKNLGFKDRFLEKRTRYSHPTLERL